MFRSLLASLHLFSIVLGIVATYGRALALREPFTKEQQQKLFRADNWAGIAAVILFATGLYRWLGGIEKEVSWYNTHPLFHLKLTLLGINLCLEMWPMITFIKWRIDVEKNRPLNTKNLHWIRRFNNTELVILIVLLFVAPAMARGVGYSSKQGSALPVECQAQVILRNMCANCHSETAKSGGLVLTGNSHEALVDVSSSQWPTVKRVVGAAPEQSLLLKKIKHQQGNMGVGMPPGSRLNKEDVHVIETWIREGAKRCEK